MQTPASFCGESPGYTDNSPVEPVAYSLGFIPVSSAMPFMQGPPPPVGDLSQCSRSQILQSAWSLCTQPHGTMEQKFDQVTTLVGHLVQLLLLEPNKDNGVNGSPLASSWTTTNSGSSSIPAGAVATGINLHAATATGAGKLFLCPVCPSKRYTEKGFHKHVTAWKKKSKVCGKRTKKSSCPGIGCHPQFSTLGKPVECVVSETLKLLTPGANAAHVRHGTGNHLKVAEYFKELRM